MATEQSSSVKAGIFVVVGAIVVILFILALGQRTQLFTHQYTLKTTFGNATGLLPGAAVRVAGVNAGSVRSVQIVREPSGVSLVEVDLNIGTAFQDSIRTDSVALVRSLGILGDKYVEISIGPAGEPLKPGATLRSEESTDLYQIADEARETFRRANAIGKAISDVLAELDKAAFVQRLHEAAESLSRLLANAEKGPSLIHSLAYDPEAGQMLEELHAAAKAIRESAEQVRSGKGDLGEIIHGDRLSRALTDFAEAAASARDILKEVQKGPGAAHALVYSPSEREALAQLASAAVKLNEVITDIHEARGTLGLLIADPSAWERLERILGGVEESRTLKFLIEHSAK